LYPETVIQITNKPRPPSYLLTGGTDDVADRGGPDDPDGREAMTCPVCDGEPAVLGALGFWRWLRCRACGLTYKVRANESEE
jgi:hypothetical protein